MNPIDQCFVNTTVDPQAVRQYLDEDPCYRQMAIKRTQSAHMRSVASHMDSVEFHLRRYLIGNAKTMHRLLWELRAFMAVDGLMARRLTIVILNQNQKALLQNEWYEFMPRFEYARTQINRLFLL